MKIALALLCCLASKASAFTVAPKAAFAVTQARYTTSFSLAAVADDNLSVEDEVELMVQEAKAKMLKVSKLSNAKGQEYAPWMNMTPEDEARIRQVARDKTQARRRRQDEANSLSGSLLKDSTNQELSGTGLRSKVIDGDSVELEWATGSERNTKGFIVQQPTLLCNRHVNAVRANHFR